MKNARTKRICLIIWHNIAANFTYLACLQLPFIKYYFFLFQTSMQCFNYIVKYNYFVSILWKGNFRPKEWRHSNLVVKCYFRGNIKSMINVYRPCELSDKKILHLLIQRFCVLYGIWSGIFVYWLLVAFSFFRSCFCFCCQIVHLEFLILNNVFHVVQINCDIKY